MPPELATNFKEEHISLTPQAFTVTELTKTDVLRVLLFLEEAVTLHYQRPISQLFPNQFPSLYGDGHSWVT